MRFARAALVAILGCASCSSNQSATDAGISDAAIATSDGAVANTDAFPHPDGFLDEDQDGLDDNLELLWAHEYLPFLSLAPDDGCPTSGLLVRVSPLAGEVGLIRIFYDVLYNEDCGLAGHPGDSEAFGVTVNVALPPPMGIVAIKAIAHKSTACEVTSTCGRCSGLMACQTLTENSVPRPAVWPSRDKHGNFVNRNDTCELTSTCLDECADRSMPVMPAIVNAGEPSHPLVRNLTAQGFITTANGWTEMQLFNYDPWGGQPFGGGGNVAADLVDPAFDAPACP